MNTKQLTKIQSTKTGDGTGLLFSRIQLEANGHDFKLAAFKWINEICPKIAYCDWDLYSLDNGGFFIAPVLEKKTSIYFGGNC